MKMSMCSALSRYNPEEPLIEAMLVGCKYVVRNYHQASNASELMTKRLDLFVSLRVSFIP